jgi:hypothetical protein
MGIFGDTADSASAACALDKGDHCIHDDGKQVGWSDNRHEKYKDKQSGAFGGATGTEAVCTHEDAGEGHGPVLVLPPLLPALPQAPTVVQVIPYDWRDVVDQGDDQYQHKGSYGDALGDTAGADAPRAHVDPKMGIFGDTADSASEACALGKLADAAEVAEMTWQSSQIPATIRRPWRVYEEDLEDTLEDTYTEDPEALAAVRDGLSAVQARGAVAAFRGLTQDLQRTYAEVSLLELSAFVCYSRAQMQQGGTRHDIVTAWDTLDCDSKADWVPESPRAALAVESRWAPLLADGPPQCGDADGATARPTRATRTAPTTRYATSISKRRQ